jgi:RNA-directed DNA polymerase
MTARQFTIRNLVAAFLAGPWTLPGLVQRGTAALGWRQRWVRSLARRLLMTFGADPAHVTADALERFIEQDAGFLRAWARSCTNQEMPVRQLFWTTPSMMPAPGAPQSWNVPDLPTSGALAEWLGIRPEELDWFADCQSREAHARPEPLRHYTYRWLRQLSGKLRLLEIPKRRLKAIQRQVLHEILERIPAHDAVHSYRHGRSVVSYASPHAGQSTVLHMDLRDFFPSLRFSRVHALFHTAGYPARVARYLTGLCTNTIPEDVWDEGMQLAPDRLGQRERQIFRVPHVPQGAPTSGALGNLCAYRLDCRLAGLARAAGARYTRYADDLAFSGGKELAAGSRRFHVLVCRIALEEGFEINTRKTRLLRQGVRQCLAGVVVNSHPNSARVEYEQLKAILHNCERLGPQSQNRQGKADFRAHLLGRIAYLQMINAARGQRLRSCFDRIIWA